MVLAWADPPPAGNRTVAELAARPGIWAHVGTAHNRKVGAERARALRAAGRKEHVLIETDVAQEGKHVRIYARAIAE